MSLSEFLLARIAEDEADAEKVREEWAEFTSHGTPGVGQVPWLWEDETVACNPVRVLAECEAKRRIVERETGSRTKITYRRMMVLQDLAAVYADHPDYDESWRH